MGALQHWVVALLLSALVPFVESKIDRKSIVSQFNLRLNQTSSSPVQVGNGNFAFSTDITGLQTFVPFNTLSSWGWHNSSLPVSKNGTTISPDSFTGLDWWTHGRLVNYEQPNPAESAISQWLIGNPHRINLGRIGLWFHESLGNVSEETLSAKNQVLNLWEGVIESSFEVGGEEVTVRTAVHPETDTVAVEINSELVGKGLLGVFFDYPYASDKNKFDAPYVGVWNATKNHTTTLHKTTGGAEIEHTLDTTTYYTTIAWDGSTAAISGPANGTHRYTLKPGQNDSNTLSFTATFAPSRNSTSTTVSDVEDAVSSWWSAYWESGAFISLPTTTNSSAAELQRRIILTQYLLAVNSAGKDPPQESGLVNNGWYGKFHLEMVFWHLMHWSVWNKWDLLQRSVPGVYDRFLPSSMARAQKQGYQGARWGKMSDPSGRSAPGEINSLLIWQQPHPMYFAEMEWRAFPTNATLAKWDKVIDQAATFMTTYAWHNDTTGKYDLGPPMYPVSENTNPNQTINPAFELAYWRFGLDVAMKWKERQQQYIQKSWRYVIENLAPLPVQDGAYVTYEGMEDMWTNPDYAEDHPALLGMYGWLPPDPTFNRTIFDKTIEKVNQSWNFTDSYGWDFPLLAMTAARTGDAETAVDWLLDPNNQYDEVGMPEGGTRVPTPYFPASAGLLLAVGMMAGGWDGLEGPIFPKNWDVEMEGFVKAM